MRVYETPEWVTFPEEDWRTIAPEDAGLDPVGFRRFLGTIEAAGASIGGEAHEGDDWGTVITRGGYLLHTWGDRDFRFQTASMAKAFSRAIFGLAVREGMVEPDDLVSDTWTGEDQLSHSHKYLDQGHHRALTWNHLLGYKFGHAHLGGFPINHGYYWEKGPSGVSRGEEEGPTTKDWRAPFWEVPDWADWTGDPFYDNYAHTEPGTIGHYSGGGMWRLTQALTVLWDQDIKDVLDERLFSRIGVKADSWQWPSGRSMRDDRDFYPQWPTHGAYLDPPYEIDGHAVRGGPGWAVMNASDLARFGHLVATRGNWKGEQLIDPQWLRGHSGGNGSGVSGESRHYTALASVATRGIDHPFAVARESFLPAELFVGPVKAAAA
jgi:CubicO group peptidase (beta-lactamase class C family)